MTRLVFLITLAATLITSVARADVGDSEQQYDPGPAQRRWGFAMGLSFLAASGAVSGYPLNVDEIGNPDFKADTGASGGAGGGLWIGGALRDWLVLGIGLNALTVAGSDAVSSNGGIFMFHVEVFPALELGGPWRDVAFVGEFGAGARDIFDASKEVANSGAMSSISLGVLYEPLRIGRHVSAGPIAMFTHQFSDSIKAFLGTAGVQLVFYGGSS